MTRFKECSDGLNHIRLVDRTYLGLLLPIFAACTLPSRLIEQVNPGEGCNTVLLSGIKSSINCSHHKEETGNRGSLEEFDPDPESLQTRWFFGLVGSSATCVTSS